MRLPKCVHRRCMSDGTGGASADAELSTGPSWQWSPARTARRARSSGILRVRRRNRRVPSIVKMAKVSCSLTAIRWKPESVAAVLSECCIEPTNSPAIRLERLRRLINHHQVEEAFAAAVAAFAVAQHRRNVAFGSAQASAEDDLVRSEHAARREPLALPQLRFKRLLFAAQLRVAQFTQTLYTTRERERERKREGERGKEQFHPLNKEG